MYLNPQRYGGTTQLVLEWEDKTMILEVSLLLITAKYLKTTALNFSSSLVKTLMAVYEVWAENGVNKHKTQWFFRVLIILTAFWDALHNHKSLQAKWCELGKPGCPSHRNYFIFLGAYSFKLEMEKMWEFV